MALEPPRGALGKVSIVFATKLKSFTFLPLSKKLPTENRVKPVWGKGWSKLREAIGDRGSSEGKTTAEGNYKAEVVYISDTELQEINKHSENQPEDSTTQSPITAVADDEISCTHLKPCSGALDTADNKPPVKPQIVCHTPGTDINYESQREEEVLSPVSSVDIFTSPFSSKESILSEGWEQEPGWSAFQMLSPSGSISPCSSVRSGAFTPSVMRIKCHKLAPASSLMQMPLTSSLTHVCNKHIASPCPFSNRGRHRPPPTHLSLLTAILRKGRLPVLSSALQRPYSPCWPISPVNMSSCMACLAASNISPMVGLRAKSCASKGTTCTEPGCKARQKPTGLNAKTDPVSPKDQTEEAETIDVSNMYAARSRILPTSEGRSSLNLTSYSPLVLPPAHLSKQTHKGLHESTDPSLLLSTSPPSSSRPRPFSPDSNLHFEIQKNGHKSHDPPPIWDIGNTNPCQTSGSGLKLKQITHERSPTPDPTPNPRSPDRKASAAPKYASVSPGCQLRKDIVHELKKIQSLSPVFNHPPSPRVTHLSDRPSISPSPRPDSCTSTSDRYTLSTSPAIPYHLLSPSPSYSLCSSPTSSLRNVSPDRMDRGSKKPYKIKSTYKALAAIPTNTLLLEQQAIDDEVNKKEASLDPSDGFAWEDPHSQMCTPAELRQQSAELYQVIDEVLKDAKRAEAASPANKLAAGSETTWRTTLSPSPRSLGRETKYATFHQQPPDPAEKTLTKPGVIRPAAPMSRTCDPEKSGSFNIYRRPNESFSADQQYKRVGGATEHESGGGGGGGGRGRGSEGDGDSSQVPEKTLGRNRAAEHTPAPKGACL